MKKVLTFVCAVVLCLSSCVYFVGCGKKDKGTIRLNEVTPSMAGHALQ